ncbi:hypothetical protein V496_07335 [Pseudogymnoascus sp. VKM F-4515 (FW-2607)]|nr:hypothetical protein V496_07335 [Pseudogymnoascus sp. VKM F-4515 (FW-2607)]KFY77452.1 hypothetical protein V498_09325 [Pseudogymnoascus sp. VKM F-4517 (FW-2822)]
MCNSDLFLAFIAILFPPLPVWVKSGLCSADSLINILLCMLGFIPGLLHAWYIIAKNPELESYDALPQDAEAGSRVTYIYVQTDGSGPRQQQQNQQREPQGYGTVKPMDAPQLQQHQNGTWGQGSAPHEDGEGSHPAPPTYAQAVTGATGDHKVQTHE